MMEQSERVFALGLPSQVAAFPRVESQQGVAEVQREKNQAAIRLLESWSEGDAQEQRETWEYLKRVLDQDRSSERRLFP